MSCFLIQLEPVPDASAPPAEIRLRQALKTLLRTHKLRCVEVREIRDQRPADREQVTAEVAQ